MVTEYICFQLPLDSLNEEKKQETNIALVQMPRPDTVLEAAHPEKLPHINRLETLELRLSLELSPLLLLLGFSTGKLIVRCTLPRCRVYVPTGWLIH